MCVLVLVWRIKKQNIYLLKVIQAWDFMINDFIRYLVEGSKIVDNTKFLDDLKAAKKIKEIPPLITIG